MHKDAQQCAAASANPHTLTTRPHACRTSAVAHQSKGCSQATHLGAVIAAQLLPSGVWALRQVGAPSARARSRRKWQPPSRRGLLDKPDCWTQRTSPEPACDASHCIAGSHLEAEMLAAGEAAREAAREATGEAGALEACLPGAQLHVVAAVVGRALLRL